MQTKKNVRKKMNNKKNAVDRSIDTVLCARSMSEEKKKKTYGRIYLVWSLCQSPSSEGRPRFPSCTESAPPRSPPETRALRCRAQRGCIRKTTCPQAIRRPPQEGPRASGRSVTGCRCTRTRPHSNWSLSRSA